MSLTERARLRSLLGGTDKIEERLEEAKKTEGETDIADALRARANYLTRIGDKVRSLRH